MATQRKKMHNLIYLIFFVELTDMFDADWRLWALREAVVQSVMPGSVAGWRGSGVGGMTMLWWGCGGGGFRGATAWWCGTAED